MKMKPPNLRDLRQVAKLTQAEAAQQISDLVPRKVYRHEISRYEHGRHEPSLVIIQAMSAIYRQPINRVIAAIAVTRHAAKSRDI